MAKIAIRAGLICLVISAFLVPLATGSFSLILVFLGAIYLTAIFWGALNLVRPDLVVGIKSEDKHYRKQHVRRVEARKFGIELLTLLLLAASIGFSGLQTVQLREQIELENRPYLYIDIVPSVTEKLEPLPNGGETWNLYLGAKLVYKNVGGIPASKIDTEVHMYNDADKGDDAKRLEEYYVKEFGYFPKPTTVFPNQTGQEIALFVDAGDGAKQYLITIRVAYAGEDPRKKYWYSADMRYRVDKDALVEVQSLTLQQESGQTVQKPVRKRYGVWLLESKTDYDAVGRIKLPPAAPNPYQ